MGTFKSNPSLADQSVGLGLVYKLGRYYSRTVIDRLWAEVEYAHAGHSRIFNRVRERERECVCVCFSNAGTRAQLLLEAREVKIHSMHCKTF